MSQRASPAYDHGFCSYRGHPLQSASNAMPSSAAPQSICIYAALERASLADVRRAVAADSTVLQSAELPTTLRFHPFRLFQDCRKQMLFMSPIDYTLHLLSTWNAILEHCDRTGVMAAVLPFSTGSLTLREALSILTQIGKWLVSQRQNPQPHTNAVHVAIGAKLPELACAICRQYPSLSTLQTQPNLKSPVHTLAATVASSANLVHDFMRLARILLRAPTASEAIWDADYRTALHDLLLAYRAAPPYGLSSTRTHASSLNSVAPLIEILIANGADPCSPDRHGMSPLALAIRSHDYLVIVNVADRVYLQLTRSSSTLRHSLEATHLENDEPRDRSISSAQCCSGILYRLPDDILLQLFKYLTPREASCGLGATCRRFRSLSRRQDLWRHLSKKATLEHVRDVLQSTV